MFLLFGRALAPVFLHPLQDGGKNLEKVYCEGFRGAWNNTSDVWWFVNTSNDGTMKANFKMARRIVFEVAFKNVQFSLLIVSLIRDN